MSKYNIDNKFVLEIKEIDELRKKKYIRTKYLDKFKKLDDDYVNENFKELLDEAYNKGLNDVWELAKKIALSPIDNGVPNNKLIEMFGYSGENCIQSYHVFKNFTLQEVLAKFEVYEKEQAEIKVGDEITVVDSAIKGYVIDKSKEHKDCYVMLVTNYKDLRTAIYNKSVIQKTGKHIDIQNKLRQLWN